MTSLALSDRIKISQTDPKAATVLEAGYETFLLFGLKRASMQDIADRAGMSRAALYLHFKNKDDIFRAMMAAYYAAAAEAAGEALAANEDVAKSLIAAFDAQLGDAGERLMCSPHAEEMMSMKHKAADVIMEGHRNLALVYARWLEKGVQTGKVDPVAVAGSAERTAQVMLSALDGMKLGSQDWDSYIAARRHLARIFARAISTS